MPLINRLCPRCGNKYLDYPAISRKDNKTEICPTCGQAEALLEMIGQEDEEWYCDKQKEV